MRTLMAATEAAVTAMDGASQQFERLVRDHSRLAYRVAYSVLRNPADAEDAVQETFVKVLRARLEGVNDEAAWIASIAYRTALDMLPKRRHVDVDEIDLASGGESRDEVLSREQQVARLRTMVAALPEELRTPLTLSMVEELNSRQIAEVLGISDGTVRTRLLRARQLLKEKLSATAGKRSL